MDSFGSSQTRRAPSIRWYCNSTKLKIPLPNFTMWFKRDWTRILCQRTLMTGRCRVMSSGWRLLAYSWRRTKLSSSSFRWWSHSKPFRSHRLGPLILVCISKIFILKAESQKLGNHFQLMMKSGKNLFNAQMYLISTTSPTSNILTPRTPHMTPMPWVYCCINWCSLNIRSSLKIIRLRYRSRQHLPLD